MPLIGYFKPFVLLVVGSFMSAADLFLVPMHRGCKRTSCFKFSTT